MSNVKSLYGPESWLPTFLMQFFIIIIRSFPAKCVIPCLNGGRCKGVNKCRCPVGLGGNHCEVGRRVGDCSCRGENCATSHTCRHGRCVAGACVCEPGWRGRWCHRSTGQPTILTCILSSTLKYFLWISNYCISKAPFYGWNMYDIDSIKGYF